MANKRLKKEQKAAERRRKIAQQKHTDRLAAQPKPPSKFVNQYAHPGILAVGGPLISCEWSVPKVLEDYVIAAGRPVPPPVHGQLLLDTGASRTCIAQSVARELGLTPLRLQKCYGAGGMHEAAVYRVRLTIRLADHKGVTEIQSESEAQEIPGLEESIAPLKLTHQGLPVRLVGLLGRDLLRHAKLYYDGISGRIELNFDLESLKRFSQRGTIP